MHLKKLAVCGAAGLLALAVACGKNSPAPTSPSASSAGGVGAAADGSTLKASAPTPVSPINGEQPQSSLVLVAQKSTGTYADFNPSYQFQIRSGSNVVYDSGVVGGVGAGANNVQHTPTTALIPDTTFTWRARASYQGAFGPWSSDATFKSPLGGYLRGAELYDPLLGGRTVGSLQGGATLTDEGVFLPSHEAHVDYQLEQTLEQGEFSMMVKGLVVQSPGTQGAKSKVFSMQEGGGDITTDDYRMTADFRGKQYPNPGAVTFRIITGDAGSRVFDGQRIVVGGWDRNTWYFWRFSWQTGRATLEVREGSETGPIKYLQSTGTGSHPYRPTPHVLHLGQPVGRGGPDDATACPITIKNVWASANPRPAFPQ
jgi:hypothetical protein